ncbi:hypothetical protein MO867_07755 [Microbulbifer sp. OS29]|uniref:Uncharacterized protein n=1 Tax=Microbulbifer okhotskensis TaxID=2926617 RepID=A0A9X2EL53_9GAMM|nr:hypothetical protein [Microbulbifer okhotskensis]MCO1334237.1 hypothetical protein [Microbulbifer okhotskensis]
MRRSDADVKNIVNSSCAFIGKLRKLITTVAAVRHLKAATENIFLLAISGALGMFLCFCRTNKIFQNGTILSATKECAN